MSEIFVTSDHHFFHANIIKYCNRPFFSYQEMNEVMIKRWNKVVGKNDVVIYCGDFAWRGKARLIRPRLNGTIILVRGNHDLTLSKRDGFVIIEGNLGMGNMIFSHEPLEEVPKGIINIHGHIHHHDSDKGINVSVEKTNYYPIKLKDVMKYDTRNGK